MMNLVVQGSVLRGKGSGLCGALHVLAHVKYGQCHQIPDEMLSTRFNAVGECVVVLSSQFNVSDAAKEEWCGIEGRGWRFQKVEPKKKMTEEIIVSSYAKNIGSFPRCAVEETTLMETERNEWKGWREGLNNVKGSTIDFKIHMKKVFEVVVIGERKNQELSINIGYVLSNLSCQESRIDDMGRDIKEMLGNIDRIVEDVKKMVNMNQWSHFQ